MEKLNTSLKGMYRDVLKDKNNNIVFDSGWNNNLVVDTCYTLLAALMKGDGNAKSIQCIKVGQGSNDWDDNGPPPPVPKDTKLKDTQHYCFYIDDTSDPKALTIEYKRDEGSTSTGPTSKLQITLTLDKSHPPLSKPGTDTYPLREFGLFGKYSPGSDNPQTGESTACRDKNDDYMIDYITHPVINISASDSLERTIILDFKDTAIKDT